MKQPRTARRWNKKRIAEFMDKQGFYIVVSLCVMTLIGTAILTQRQVPPQVEEQAQLEPSANPVRAQWDEEESLQQALEKQRLAQQSQQSATRSPLPTLHTPTPSPAPAMAKWVWPADGKLLQEYHSDVLIYSETLDEWTTHMGIDIAGIEGQPVRAVAEGTVVSAVKDAFTGNTIRIDHGDGYSTVYAGLSTLAMVRVGDPLQAGQAIGYMGNSAVFEALMETHLHFEVWKDGAAVDPLPLLEKRAS